MVEVWCVLFLDYARWLGQKQNAQNFYHKWMKDGVSSLIPNSAKPAICICYSIAMVDQAVLFKALRVVSLGVKERVASHAPRPCLPSFRDTFRPLADWPTGGRPT